MSETQKKKARTVGIIAGILFGIGSIIPGVLSACPCCGLFTNVMVLIGALFFGSLAGLIAAIIADWTRISYDKGIGTGAQLGFRAGIIAGFIGGGIATAATALSLMGLTGFVGSEGGASEAAEIAPGAFIMVLTQAAINLILAPLFAALPGALLGVIVGAIRRRPDGVEEIEEPIKELPPTVPTHPHVTKKRHPLSWMEPETETEPEPEEERDTEPGFGTASELESERDTDPDLDMDPEIEMRLTLSAQLIGWGTDIAKGLRPLFDLMLRGAKSTGAFLQKRVITPLRNVDWGSHFQALKGSFQRVSNRVAKRGKNVRVFPQQQTIRKSLPMALGLTAILLVAALGIAFWIGVFLFFLSERNEDLEAYRFPEQPLAVSKVDRPEESAVMFPEPTPTVVKADSGIQPRPSDGDSLDHPAPEKASSPPQPSSPPPHSSESRNWWCLCYSENVNGVATPSTACRKTRGECRRLARKVRLGRRQSRKVGCSRVHTSHPENVLGKHGLWEPSSYRGGGWWTKEGCLLPDREPTVPRRNTVKRKGVKQWRPKSRTPRKRESEPYRRRPRYRPEEW